LEEYPLDAISETKITKSEYPDEGRSVKIIELSGNKRGTIFLRKIPPPPFFQGGILNERKRGRGIFFPLESYSHCIITKSSSLNDYLKKVM
jgi:hypothetical protein